VGEALAIRGDLAPAQSVSEPVLLDLADEGIARSVLALQREAYAVEAELIAADGIPQLSETFGSCRRPGWTGWGRSMRPV